MESTLADPKTGTLPAGPCSPEAPALAKFAGNSPSILEVIAKIKKVARSHLTVLIQGETGVGKEPAARALHEESARHDKPFVAVDCGALPENLLESELFGHEKGAFSGADRKKQGQIELAEGGTLFLDEIGNLPFSLQAKLLRVLEERQVRPVGAARAFAVNVRLIAASNSSLTEAARAGRFRHDLYYRLAEFTLQLPPLRCRREDIQPLAERFREEACREFQRSVTGLSPEALILLKDHPWPGNVRELRNVIRQSVLLTHDSAIHAHQIMTLLGGSADLETSDLGDPLVPPAPGLSLRQIVENAVKEVERQTILSVLKSTGGNKAQAAKDLKLDYKTLRMKIKKYGLEPSHRKRNPS
jgi:two-component system nitrogen regulation response regulator GlnG